MILKCFLQDQDSWTGGSGGGAKDSKPMFDIFTGEPIPCRRSHLQCSGFHACSEIDPKLLEFERYELDSSTLEAVIAAQVKSRMEEANTAEKLAVTVITKFIGSGMLFTHENVALVTTTVHRALENP
ncbi:hypothetical protein H0H92_012247 [Tricholoma furcatifolium]|nr:hypothetical protein H0H92_012247 [Tricholoma furcatifolium]